MIKIVKIVTMIKIVRTKQVKPKHNKDCETKDLLTNGFQCLSNPQLLLPGFLQTWKEIILKNANTQILRNLSPFLDDHPDEGGEGGVAKLLLQVRSHPGVPSVCISNPTFLSSSFLFWKFQIVEIVE